MQCTQCKAIVQPDANFCAKCGAPVLKCVDCGRVLLPEDRFCSSCGTPVTDSSSSAAKQPARPRRKRKAAPTVRAADQPAPIDALRAQFERGLQTWLASREYNMGVPTSELDLKDDLGMVEKSLEILKGFASTAMPFVISGKISAQEMFDVVVPFLKLGDLVGFAFDSNMNKVVVVLYADALSAEELVQRVEAIFEVAPPLADVGMRMNGQSMASGSVHVLAVYFDPARYAQHAALAAATSRRDILERVYLYTGYISVPEQKVVWSQPIGRLGAMQRSIAGFLGTAKNALAIIDEQDLHNIMLVGERA